ncbi:MULTISPECIES: hypothetical protein [Acidithrix]|nr:MULTISPECIES: hypothetical protein [Acidithrix]CAG4911278.1 unnamed protein product [Acidithrix sp. C25]
MAPRVLCDFDSSVGAVLYIGKEILGSIAHLDGVARLASVEA